MELYCGDCLEVMKSIEDKSIDMILCDLPYSMTSCEWDCLIPFDKLWEQYKRIRKDNTPIVLFGSEPFSTYLRMSNIKEFKYDWYWNKDKGNGIFLAKIQPLRTIETISVFYKNQCLYNPQMTKAQVDRIRPLSFANKNGAKNNIVNCNNCKVDKEYNPDLRYPLNLLTFNKPISKGIHPTQKPVALLEYLIKTYSNEGDIVLDNCMGSGTTGVACYNTNRHFIGIEKDETYFKLAKERIDNAMAQLRLF